MSRKLLIVSQFVWVGIAAAAFFLGRGSGGDEASIAKTNPASSSPDRAGHASSTPIAGDSRSSRSADASESAELRTLFDVPQLSPEAMGRALASAFAENDPLVRKQKISTLLAGLTAENVPATLEAFENGPKGEDRRSEFHDFLNAWGRIDGAAAMAYAMDPKSPKRDHYGATHAAMGWAVSEPGAAADYVESMDAGHGKEWVHYGVVRGMLESDLDAATAFSEKNKLSRARGQSMDRLAERIVQEGGVAGLQRWLDGIDPAGENDMLAYKRYALNASLARMDGESARGWIEEHAAEPYVNDDAIVTAVSRGFGSDYVGALDWLDGLGGNEAIQREAFGEVVERWADRDPNAAAGWLGQNQRHPNYDEAASEFAREIVRDDPESALAWAQTMHDEKAADQLSVRLLQEWRRSDPSAAQAYLDTASESP